MKTLIQRFWNEEAGNAVVDWCVLGAGAASLGLALAATLVG